MDKFSYFFLNLFTKSSQVGTLLNDTYTTRCISCLNSKKVIINLLTAVPPLSVFDGFVRNNRDNCMDN